MKQEIAKLWTQALRSGKYEQTTHVLKSPDGYCCLGVLCDISGISEWNNMDLYGGMETPLLPSTVMDWSGIKSPPGYYGEKKKATALTRDNDCGRSFSEIADIIDLHWESL